MTTAKNSRDAQAILAQGDVDLAIFDVDLGPTSVNGFNLLADERSKGMKALACIHTNRILLDDNKRAIDAGADIFLPKPMARSHLLKLIVQAVDKSISNIPTPCITSAVTTAKAEEVLIAVVDDDIVAQMAWEMEFDGGKVLSFNCPENFLSVAEKNSEMINSLTCVITDLNFGPNTGTDGLVFGKEFKTMFPNIPILLSSNATVAAQDWNGSVDAVIGKEPIKNIQILR